MIYLLEDDASIRNFVEYALNNSGFEAKGFERPSDFWRALDSKAPKLVLLDIMLPEEDGLEVLRKLRARKDTKNVPVIMLTAKTTEYDRVLGLDSGADDYISKPFGIMELLSRIKALLRRCNERAEKDTREYTAGDIYICPHKHIVRAGGRDVALTFKEFELLCLLMSNQGTVFSRDRILQSIWGYEFDGENRTVDVHIRTLRSKLGESGDIIETVRGVGYKIGE
ncbi:MAG: response regulator transcription factor [Ruminococcaceae bacterium]|nr:response regulator transcription factor [Oscillospiraceae bacterium]